MGATEVKRIVRRACGREEPTKRTGIAPIADSIWAAAALDSSKIRWSISALVLVVGLLAFLGRPATVSAAEPCTGGTFPPNETGQIYVEKYAADAPGSGTFFDRVQGDATVRNFDVCTGVDLDPNDCLTQGGTAVLPANVQNDITGHVYQLGVAQFAGLSKKFVYTNSTDLCARNWPTITPIVGHRYRFIIYRDSNGKVVYQIDDLATSGIDSTMYTNYTWSTSRKHAWWGYETWDKNSSFGVAAGSSQNQMAYMGYSKDGSGTIYYRSDLTTSDIRKNSHAETSDHGHIGDWVFNNDMLSAESH